MKFFNVYFALFFYFLILFSRIIPESARWLISQRRFQEADEILQKAAKFNKRTLPPNWYEQLETDVKISDKNHFVLFL